MAVSDSRKVAVIRRSKWIWEGPGIRRPMGPMDSTENGRRADGLQLNLTSNVNKKLLLRPWGPMEPKGAMGPHGAHGDLWGHGAHVPLGPKPAAGGTGWHRLADGGRTGGL